MPNLKTREINDNVFDMPPKHKNFRMQVIHHISILICCRSQVNKQHTVDPLFSTFDRFHSLKKIAVLVTSLTFTPWMLIWLQSQPLDQTRIVAMT